MRPQSLKRRKAIPYFSHNRYRDFCLHCNYGLDGCYWAFLKANHALGGLWYDTPDNAIGYAMHSSRSHDAVIRVYNAAGNVIETHEHKGDFKEP